MCERMPSAVDRYQLTGLHLAYEPGTHDVQRRVLAGHDPPGLELTDDQRVDPLRVPRRVQRLLVHEHEAVRTAKFGENGGRRLEQRTVGIAGHQVRDQPGVGGRAFVTERVGEQGGLGRALRDEFDQVA